jgi:O-antigen/teichoic acid export membrane protein
MKELITATLKMGTSSFIATLFRIISSKILAVMLGPSGIGLLSILGNIVQVFTSMVTFNGSQAIIQAIASKRKREGNVYKGLILGFYVVMLTLLSICLIIFAKPLSQLFFEEPRHIDIVLIRLLILPIIINVILSYFTSILNGYRFIGQLAILAVISASVTAIISYPLALLIANGNIELWAIYLLIPSFISLLFAYWYVRTKNLISTISFNFFRLSSQKIFQHFFSISGTLLITGLITTGTLLYIRTLISQNMGLDSLGYFSVAWSLSLQYIMLFLSSFGTYYFPALANTKEDDKRLHLMYNIQHLTILVTLPLIIFVILLKPFIVSLLFSSDFLISLDIIRWMLLGDFLKASSWTIGMLILANADMKVFFWKEIALNIIFLIIAYISIEIYHNLEGVGQGYLVMYIVNLGYLLHYAIKKYNYALQKNIIMSWLSGFSFIIFVSVLTWHDKTLNFTYIAIGIPFSLLISWISLRNNEKKIILYYIKKLKLNKGN